MVDASLQCPMVFIIDGITKGLHTSTLTSEAYKLCQAGLLEYQKRGFSIILAVDDTL